MPKLLRGRVADDQRPWRARIRARRKALNLTQGELAARLREHGSKADQGTVSEWEKGRAPDVTALATLADVLECSVDYLVGRTDVATRPTEGEALRRLAIIRAVVEGREPPTMPAGSDADDPDSLAEKEMQRRQAERREQQENRKRKHGA